MRAQKKDILGELAAEIETNPPVNRNRTSRLEHPTIRAWLDELMRQRDSGEHRPFAYVASVLTRLGRKHGILKGLLKEDERAVLGCDQG